MLRIRNKTINPKLKCLLFFVFLVSITSCKSKKILAEAEATKMVAADKVIENHYAAKKDFKTIYIKASAKYEDEKQTQNVSAEIKIKKDEKILVSIRVFGITMAKGLITPTEVKYYEKINNKYFEGDYTTLSKWLGTDLDFEKVQNMLIGQALDDLKKGKYDVTIEDGLYKLENKSNKNTEKTFFFEASQYLIKKQEIVQQSKDRKLTVGYQNHKNYPEIILPAELSIQAIQGNKKTNINLEYNTVTFNEDLSFPYSVPDSYDRIFID